MADEFEDYEFEGGDEWTPVGSMPEDMETERLSRMVDSLNNRIYSANPIMSFGKEEGVNLSGESGFKTRPKVETEDSKLQDKRREFENNRRNWNSGLGQEQAKYNQNMELLSGVRRLNNKLKGAGMTIDFVLRQNNPHIQYILGELLGVKGDDRNMEEKLWDKLYELLIPRFVKGGKVDR